MEGQHLLYGADHENRRSQAMIKEVFRSIFLWATFVWTGTNVWGTNPRGVGWEAALKQVKELKPADGLEVTLFASEPMVVNPTNIDIDARGRVWVAEGANYRLWQKWGKLRSGGDRIVILEDTNLDGVADRQKVFYQGDDVNAALGICVLGNQVIVSCSPQVILFTDVDGDDRPDKKETLFSNIKGVDHDHGVHAFVFGPDGRFYFNFGNEGKQICDKNGIPLADPQGNIIADNRRPYQQGMVFRCAPDLSGLEVLGHNFRNNYELCVDSFGTLWQSDNDDDGNQGENQLCHGVRQLWLQRRKDRRRLAGKTNGMGGNHSRAALASE